MRHYKRINLHTSDMAKARKPRVFVIGMGGTLAATTVKGTWKPGELTQAEILKFAPFLKKFFDIEETALFRIDSTNMQPENWLTLAQTLYYKLKSFDGIVVTHGTDTMSYTAAALSFLIQNLNMPIVFTGSQVIPTHIGSDANRNLVDAIRVASTANLAESVIVFNGQILRGNRAKKFRETDFDAFECVGMPPLGKIQQEIKLTGEQKKRSKIKPKLFNSLEPNVALIKLHPGYSPQRMEYLIDTGIKGIVLEGYGSGNIPTEKRNIAKTIKKATDQEIPVVITTQCALGSSWVYLYDVGLKALEAGAIPGHDLLSETALVKLMWVLGQTAKLDKVKKMMKTNYAGEITPGLNNPKDQALWEF